MKQNWHDVFSLRFKATMVVLTATVLALAIVTVSAVVQIRHLIAEDEQRTVAAVVQGVAHASELPLAVHDERELTHLATRFLTNDQILFIAIYDNAGKLIAHSERDNAAWSAYLENKGASGGFILGSQDVEMSAADKVFGEDDIDSDVPAPPSAINAPNGSSHSGRVVAALSTTTGQIAQGGQARLTVAITATAVAVSILITFISVGAWTRRLNQLVTASDQIAKGDFSQLIPDFRTDEIGRLARAYEKMRRALKQRDTELRDFNDNLQTQIADRTQSLEDAMKAAQSADKAKSLFLANMSHEIRTPLNGVVGMVDLLRGTNLDENQRRFIQVARSSADALLGVINDILDFSKIEAGRIELESEEMDLPTVVENLAETASLVASRKNLEVGCLIAREVPDKVIGDSTRVGQVITNLLNNAIKFTDKGQIVTRVELVEETVESALVKFSVTDSGIGIPHDRRDRLFQSFSQADASTTRKYGGTGLGLAISKRLVEMMGGTIGVESEIGKGSTFWFTCQLKKSAKPAIEQNVKLSEARPAKVLAVDDNEVNRDIISRQLSVWNIEVCTAPDARTALAMFHEAHDAGKPFEVAILDWHMPGTDGIALAGAIRAIEEFRSTKLIMLTSVEDTIKAGELKKLGFSAHLVKPVRQSRLLKAITDAMDANASPVEKAPVVAAPRPTAKGNAPAHILLAEDNEINRLVAAEILKKAGFTYDMAENGSLALTALSTNAYDLVLMDCQMPEMDGFEATKAIRARENTQSMADGIARHIPIIALTANAIKGDREMCIAAGMDDYVSKPIDPVKLIGTIEKQLAGKTRVDRPAPAPAAAAEMIEPKPADYQTDAPLDIQDVLQRCMGNIEFLDRLLGKFRNRLGEDAERLAEAVAAKNPQETARLGHSLRGSAANVSAKKLASLAAEIEKLGKADDLSTADALVEQIRAEVNRCVTYQPDLKLFGLVSPTKA